jgi:hypothetical protein
MLAIESVERTKLDAKSGQNSDDGGVVPVFDVENDGLVC